MKKPLSQIQIEFSVRFNKQLEQAPSDIKNEFFEALELFREDPKHPQLRNHPLKEKYSGYNSIDITDNWRALFRISKAKFKQ